MVASVKFFIFVCVVTIASCSSDVCQRIDKQNGVCKVITECPSLYPLLGKSSQPVTAYLKKLHCGFSGTTPKVCCPNGQPVVDNLNSTVGGKDNVVPNSEGCGLFPEGKLIGEAVAQLGQYPWNALLKYKKDDLDVFYCGGTLINNRYVLTAAHCINGIDIPMNTTVVSVRLGEHVCEQMGQLTDCTDPVLEVPVEKITIHENYNHRNPYQYNDIALIKLKNTVSFTDFVRPLCLPSTTVELTKDYNGTRLTKTGWGLFDNKIRDTEKRYGIVTGLSSDACNEKFHLKLSRNQFCGTRIKSYRLCNSDSGGFVMDTSHIHHRFYIAGIVARGTCDYDELTAYTRVNQYVPWIVENMKQ